MTVPVPGDRPAAELLARWEALEPWQDKITFQARYDYTAILTRLARAEQALADVERRCKMADRDYDHRVQMLGSTSGAGYPAVQVADIRAALRASQCGQTDYRLDHAPDPTQWGDKNG